MPWLSYSVPGITNMGLLTLTTGLSLYCYIFCVLLDAGRRVRGGERGGGRAIGFGPAGGRVCGGGVRAQAEGGPCKEYRSGAGHTDMTKR